jgi:hypothetical protein
VASVEKLAYPRYLVRPTGAWVGQCEEQRLPSEVRMPTPCVIGEEPAQLVILSLSALVVGTAAEADQFRGSRTEEGSLLHVDLGLLQQEGDQVGHAVPHRSHKRRHAVPRRLQVQKGSGGEQ